MSIYCDEQTLRPGLMFGFACAGESEIARNAARAAQAVREIGGLLS
ncbi:MAG: hypothetical protein IIC08_07505 [Proteobacteria bacterium]|nr:hypothetical protein [Pseudomonadota bacterium]